MASESRQVWKAWARHLPAILGVALLVGAIYVVQRRMDVRDRRRTRRLGGRCGRGAGRHLASQRDHDRGYQPHQHDGHTERDCHRGQERHDLPLSVDRAQPEHDLPFPRRGDELGWDGQRLRHDPHHPRSRGHGHGHQLGDTRREAQHDYLRARRHDLRPPEQGRRTRGRRSPSKPARIHTPRRSSRRARWPRPPRRARYSFVVIPPVNTHYRVSIKKPSLISSVSAVRVRVKVSPWRQHLEPADWPAGPVLGQRHPGPQREGRPDPAADEHRRLEDGRASDARSRRHRPRRPHLEILQAAARQSHRDLPRVGEPPGRGSHHRHERDPSIAHPLATSNAVEGVRATDPPFSLNGLRPLRWIVICQCAVARRVVAP